ncbi:MAG: polysaccharide biosynthesis tyrosine autokinase [Candidatus Brocadiaceae bacterium]|nr:polysaccharide biosynthesis tyrosine autokinase [Candidatus Brocadiaceae bacterium]
MPEFDENEEIHLLDYLNVIRKRMWVVIIIFIVIVAGVTIKTFKSIPVYQATSKVILEKEQLNVGIQQVVSDSKVNQSDYYTNQIAIIKSRAIAKKVIDELALTKHPDFTSAQTSVPFSETRFTDNFLSSLSVSLMRNSGIVDISYTGHNPQLITLITNTITKTYMEQDWEKRYSKAKEALSWLNKQIREVKVALEESEKALQIYKQQHGLIGIEMGGGRSANNPAGEQENVILQRLMELNSEVTKAKIERIKLETHYNRLKKYKHAREKGEAVQSITAMVQNDLIQILKEKYVDTERNFFLYSKRYGAKHPKIHQLKLELRTIQDSIDDEINRVYDSVATEFEIMKNREATLISTLEQQKAEVFSLGDKAIQYGVLRREVDTNRQMYDTLLTRMKETNLTEDLKTSDIRVLDYAEVPLSPIKPNKRLNLLLGLIMGLGCGVGLAFLMEYIDNTIKTQEDVEKYLKTSLLGIIGHIPLEKNDKDLTPLIANDSPKHTITEAFRGIRTSIMFSLPDKPKKTLLITSTRPSEGKSLVSCNLGAVMAQTGMKVLIIDADLRKPSLHEYFEADKSRGLSNLLVKAVDFGTVVHTTRVPNLFVMTCGPIPPNPSELLSNPMMAQSLETAKETFDCIIIDSPPVLMVTDARLLANIVDGILFVMKSRGTTRNSAQNAIGTLSNVQGKILGAVINDVNFARNKYYYHYYSQYYYSHYGEKEKHK